MGEKPALAPLESALWLALGAALALAAPRSLPAAPAAVAGQGKRAAILRDGNAAYARGDYAAAIAAYEEIRRGGAPSADLLFNLGSAYAKQGELGRAVALLERARLRSPRDLEIAENLALVRERCVDRPPAGLGPAGGRVAALAARLSPDEWFLLLSAAYVALLLTFLVPEVHPDRRRLAARLRAAALAAVLLASAGLILWHRSYGPGRRGVLIAPEAAVRSGPDHSYLAEFTLHAGSVVRVEARRGDWIKIVFSPSLRGWTEAPAIEIL